MQIHHVPGGGVMKRCFDRENFTIEAFQLVLFSLGIYLITSSDFSVCGLAWANYSSGRVWCSEATVQLGLSVVTLHKGKRGGSLCEDD